MSESYGHFMDLLRIHPGRTGVRELGKLIRGYMHLVPFENISKLYYFRTIGMNAIPTLEQFLAGIKKYRFGGTCYTNNFFMNGLLNTLGYKVKLCGADMNRPNVHMVNIVEIDGREYIVDTGYAAPFLVPLPCDLEDKFTIDAGADRYILFPKDADGCSRLALMRNGSEKHGYLVRPAAKNIEDFSDVVADSFRPDATFMNCILLVRFDLNSSRILHNMMYLQTEGRRRKKRELDHRDELEEVVEECFGIPSRITRIALEGLSLSGDAWH